MTPTAVTGEHGRQRWAPGRRIHRGDGDRAGGRLAAVDSFTLYVALRADAPLDDATVDTVAGVLRPDHDGLRVWRDEQSATLVRVTVDCDAADPDAALELGHALAAETVALGLTVEEVVAMTDEEQLVWRARP